MIKDLEKQILAFQPVDLAVISRAALMRRMDTKFVLPASLLSELLEKWNRDYKMLQIKGIRASHYETLYFDTPDFLFYNEHLRGRPTRFKVRQRKYVDSDLTFLEVKRKNFKGETIKSRIEIDDINPVLSKEQIEFIGGKINLSTPLQPGIRNSFIRLTLMENDAVERVTIDFNLAFILKNKSFESPGLSIIELKQSEFNRESTIYQDLKIRGIRPFRISKYCFGSSKLIPGLKANMYKAKILKIDKIAS